MGLLSVVALTAFPPVGQASVLGPLNGEVPGILTIEGIRFDGEAAGDHSGAGVTRLGDVNGDQITDFAIAAPRASHRRRSLSGSVYVVFGQPLPLGGRLGFVRGFRIDGARAYDSLGAAIGHLPPVFLDGDDSHVRTSVAPVGDMNGDGLDDLIVGAWGAGFEGRRLSGSAWVVFGKQDTGSIDLAGPFDGFRIVGAEAGHWVGASVAGVGDVNGDSVPDVLVGTPHASNNGRSFAGAAFVVYGKSTSTTVDLADIGESVSALGFRIDGARSGNQISWALSGAGDVNEDGLFDVAVSGRYISNNDRGFSGSVYVVYGSAGSGPDLGSLGPRGYRIDGAEAGNQIGSALASAGDVNGDRVPDLAIGSQYSSQNGRGFSGSVHIVFGATSSPTIDLAALGTRGRRIDGAEAGDQIGSAVQNIGDANGDGIPDLILGSRYASPYGFGFAGATFVVYGGEEAGVLDLAILGDCGFRIDGSTPGDQSGVAVSGAGDVDGDGTSDLLIGGMYASYNGGFSGSAWIVPAEAGLRRLDLHAVASPDCRYSATPS